VQGELLKELKKENNKISDDPKIQLIRDLKPWIEQWAAGKVSIIVSGDLNLRVRRSECTGVSLREWDEWEEVMGEAGMVNIALERLGRQGKVHTWSGGKGMSTHTWIDWMWVSEDIDAGADITIVNELNDSDHRGYVIQFPVDEILGEVTAAERGMGRLEGREVCNVEGGDEKKIEQFCDRMRMEAWEMEEQVTALEKRTQEWVEQGRCEREKEEQVRQMDKLMDRAVGKMLEADKEVGEKQKIRRGSSGIKKKRKQGWSWDMVRSARSVRALRQARKESMQADKSKVKEHIEQVFRWDEMDMVHPPVAAAEGSQWTQWRERVTAVLDMIKTSMHAKDRKDQRKRKK